MSYSLSLPALFLSVAGLVAADTYPGYEFGNMFYLGPTSDGQYITKATYSIAVPTPPTDYLEANADLTFLALWIGIQDNPNAENVLNMDFVQPVLSWAPDNAHLGCSADIEHFCVAASTYLGGDSPTQEQQAYVVVPSNSTVDFEVSLNSTTTKIDQKVWLNGELVSQQSDAAGMKPAVFYSGNECYNDGCGTLDAYKWENIVITLNAADATFDQTLTLTNAKSSGMTTTDGGKTWTIEAITIEQDALNE